MGSGSAGDPRDRVVAFAVEVLRQHRSDADGWCTGCLCLWGRLAPHPCTQWQWAAAVHAAYTADSADDDQAPPMSRALRPWTARAATSRSRRVSASGPDGGRSRRLRRTPIRNASISIRTASASPIQSRYRAQVDCGAQLEQLTGLRGAGRCPGVPNEPRSVPLIPGPSPGSSPRCPRHSPSPGRYRQRECLLDVLGLYCGAGMSGRPCAASPLRTTDLTVGHALSELAPLLAVRWAG